MPVKKQKIIRKPLSFSIKLAFVWTKKKGIDFHKPVPSDT